MPILSESQFWENNQPIEPDRLTINLDDDNKPEDPESKMPDDYECWRSFAESDVDYVERVEDMRDRTYKRIEELRNTPEGYFLSSVDSPESIELELEGMRQFIALCLEDKKKKDKVSYKKRDRRVCKKNPAEFLAREQKKKAISIERRRSRSCRAA